MAILQSDGVNNATDLILRRNGTEGLRLTSSTVQVSSINNGPLAGFRNAIINGNFDIWQRGTSHSSGTYGSADRWSVNYGGATLELSRQSFTAGQTDVPGNPTYFARFTITAAASNNANFRQRIEGVSSFAGEQITVSFWAKADAAKSIWVGHFQNFGTGGSPSAIVNTAGQVITLSTSWVRYSLTTTLPSISGKTLGSDGNDNLTVHFIVSDNTTGNAWSPVPAQTITFDIAQVQVERGPAATPFERRPIGTELALCQRYYQRGASPRGYLGTGSGTGNVYLTLPVIMRTSPSVEFTVDIGSSISIGSGSGHLNITGTVGGSSPNRRIVLSDMKLDAEL